MPESERQSGMASRGLRHSPKQPEPGTPTAGLGDQKPDHNAVPDTADALGHAVHVCGVVLGCLRGVVELHCPDRPASPRQRKGLLGYGTTLGSGLICSITPRQRYVHVCGPNAAASTPVTVGLRDLEITR